MNSSWTAAGSGAPRRFRAGGKSSDERKPSRVRKRCRGCRLATAVQDAPHISRREFMQGKLPGNYFVQRSPSPWPSPPGRGNSGEPRKTFRETLPRIQRLEFLHDWKRFSLSAGERAGVRGKRSSQCGKFYFADKCFLEHHRAFRDGRKLLSLWKSLNK